MTSQHAARQHRTEFPLTWAFSLVNPAGEPAGGGWVVATSAAGAQRVAEMSLAGLNRVVVLGARGSAA